MNFLYQKYPIYNFVKNQAKNSPNSFLTICHLGHIVWILVQPEHNQKGIGRKLVLGSCYWGSGLEGERPRFPTLYIELVCNMELFLTTLLMIRKFESWLIYLSISFEITYVFGPEEPIWKIGLFSFLLEIYLLLDNMLQM